MGPYVEYFGPSRYAAGDIQTQKLQKNGHFREFFRKKAIFCNFGFEYLPLPGELVPNAPYKYPCITHGASNEA